MSGDRINVAAHPWRFTCPNGHRSFDFTNHHFWCHACNRQQGVDPEFWEVQDKKTGRSLGREDVEIDPERRRDVPA